MGPGRQQQATEGGARAGAVSAQLPLLTRNPEDFQGMEGLLEILTV